MPTYQIYIRKDNDEYLSGILEYCKSVSAKVNILIEEEQQREKK